MPLKLIDRITAPSEYFYAVTPRDRALFEFWRLASREHYVAKSFNGDDYWRNIVMACNWCNGYRGNMRAIDAFAKITRLVRRGSHPHVIFLRTGIFKTGGYVRPPIAKKTEEHNAEIPIARSASI